MKKWLVPLTYPFVSVIAFLLSGAVGALGNGDGTGYGGLIITLVGLILYCVIVIPAICIVYSKYCLSGKRVRYLFTLYPSFLITSPFFILCFIDDKTIIYSTILFAWCEIWSLIGLFKLKRKKET